MYIVQINRQSRTDQSWCVLLLCAGYTHVLTNALYNAILWSYNSLNVWYQSDSVPIISLGSSFILTCMFALFTVFVICMKNNCKESHAVIGSRNTNVI